MIPHVDAIATDLDRTFTDTRLRLVPSAIATLRRARRQGFKTILVTGRTYPEIKKKAVLLSLFDYVIAEGGALAGTTRLLRATQSDRARHMARLRAWLTAQRIPFLAGLASVSIARQDAPALRGFPQARALTPNLNRDRADITLRGVNKGTALRALLRRPALRGARLIGFGDGENDIPLLQAVHWAVAVRNAIPALTAQADDRTRFPGGRGVADYLQRHVLDHR